MIVKDLEITQSVIILFIKKKHILFIKKKHILFKNKIYSSML